MERGKEEMQGTMRAKEGAEWVAETEGKGERRLREERRMGGRRGKEEDGEENRERVRVNEVKWKREGIGERTVNGEKD